MLGIMFQKLLSKKWMFFCLLLGCVLLIATVISFPLYQNAAFDGMLHDQFEERLLETGDWPAKIRTVAVSKKGTEGAELWNMENLMHGLADFLGVEPKENTFFYRLQKFRLNLLKSREDLAVVSLRLGYLTDLPEHVSVLSGEMYSDDGYNEEGFIEAVVTQDCMVTNNLLLGDEFQYDSLKDANGNPYKVKIVGVIRENPNDFYWDIGTDELKDAILVEENFFRQLFVENGKANDYTITCCYCFLFEYAQVRAEHVDRMLETLANSEYKVSVFSDVLSDFQAQRGRIMATLFILQVPVLVLLAVFLFMISGQMYELERNEISVIKSRGSSGAQIFRLYLYQSIFLATVGTLLGIPLGVFFCQILGSARNFLEFGLRRDMIIRFDSEVYMYLIVAALLTVLIMTLPAIKHSKITIVNLKQKKAAKSRSWWERFFIDFICLGIGLYGYYSFSKSSELIVENVLAEQSLDPLLYISSSLFIVGTGLVFIRLQPWLVKLLYFIGQRFWGPASYASFQESIKNGRKQQFIMLFLILTIALGTFHATVARTILQNAEENTMYLDGTDIVLKEKWRDNASLMEGDDTVEFQYYEPDIGKYETLEAVESYTKVVKSSVSNIGVNRINANMMAIHTKEFGEITWVDSELLEEHYYNYLNALAVEPNGVLVSRSFQTQQGYEIGHAINYTYTESSSDGSHDENYVLTGKIVGFIDYWPGFNPETMRWDPRSHRMVRSENYLIICNYSYFTNKCGTQPYEIWMGLKEGADSGDVAEWVNEKELTLEKYVDRPDDLEKTVTNPLLQGTNGVLTMGFIVMIILCAVGYLVYWVMSIRSREMMFGVLRAFGMHKRELFQMLMIEQLFSGVLTTVVGIVIGKVVSDMFTPMLQTAYAAADQILPMQLYTNPSDMVRLYSAIGLVMLTCLIVLIVLVFKLNVAKALKLGEE